LSFGTAILFGTPTQAQTTYEWIAGNNTYNASGSWSVSGNWNPSGPANGTDNTADFSQDKSFDNSPDTVTLDGTYTVGNIHFGGGAGSGHAWILNTGSGGPLTLSVSSGTPTITVDYQQTATINVVLAGTGFTQQGSGTLTIGGNSANTFSGTATFNGGATYLVKPAGVKVLGGNLTIAGNAESGILACSVIESNSEELVDTAVVTFTTTGGGQGAWELMGSTQAVAGIQDNGGGKVEIAESSTITAASSTLTLNGSGSYTYSGRIWQYGDHGAGGLLNIIKTGTGTQTFMGQHAPQWNGLTEVTAGRLVFSSNTVNIAGVLSNSATIELHTMGSFSFQATPPPTFCGTGTLVKTGPDTIYFGYVNNPGDGGANISMGTNGLFDIEQGTITDWGGLANWTNNRASLNIASGAYLVMDNGSVWADALTGAGTVNENAANGAAANLSIGVAGGSGAFTGVIETTGSTPLRLVKLGGGTQRLGGSGNSYNAGTIVSNGTLLVDNTGGSGTGSGTVTVDSGATLGGTGAIGGVVSVGASGVFQPGDPTGTFTVNNNLTLNNSSVLRYALGTSSAETVVNGNLTLGGTLDVSDAGGFTTGTYTLFSYSGTLVNNGPTIGSTPNGSWTYTINTSIGGLVRLEVTNGAPPPTDPYAQWQLFYFGCTNNCPQALGTADPFGKGMSNTNQFLAGLDPTNSASLFKIISETPSGSDVVLTWQTGGGRTDVVQATNGQINGSYSNNFQDVGSVIVPGSGDAIATYTDTGGATNVPARYYRIRLGP